MGTTTSPNMNLIIPNVSEQPGPDYASNVNASSLLIDAHDHSTGKGVQITPSGLNITADLPFNNNNATTLRTVRFQNQTTTLGSSGSDIRCLYFSGVDAYINDGSGNVIRVTQSGGITGSPGSISGLTAPATATYIPISAKFVWQSDTNTAADMDFRSAIFRNAPASSFGMTVQAPTLGGNVTVTLPNVPGASNYLAMDSSGVITAAQRVNKGFTAKILTDEASTGAAFSLGTLTFSVTRAGTYVLLNIQGNNPNADAYFETSGAGGFMELSYLRNGSTVFSTALARVGGGGGSARQSGGLLFVDYGINDLGLPVGSYTYRIDMNVAGGGTSANTSNLRLIALEA